MQKVLKLGEVCDLQNGFAFKSKDYVENSNTLNIRMSNIRPNGKFDESHNIKYLPDSYGDKFRDYRLHDGDLIIAMTDMAGNPKILGMPTTVRNLNGRTFLLNQRVGKLHKFSKEIYVPYLCYFLSTLKNFYKKKGTGGLQINISKKDILSADILVPPLSEQKSIVKKLDAALSDVDNLIAEISNQIKNSHYLVKLAINSKIENLPSSSYQKIGEVCSLVRGPFGGSLKKAFFVEKGLAIYEQSHPINNQCEIFRYFITEEKFEEMRRFEVKPNDILMSCSGVTLGRTTIVPTDAPKGIINQALLKITPSVFLLSEYLRLIMQSNFFQKRIWEVSGGAAQPNVPSVKILKNMTIPVPSLKEQKKFIDWKQTLDKYKLASLYEQKRNLLITLKEAILLNEVQSKE